MRRLVLIGLAISAFIAGCQSPRAPETPPPTGPTGTPEARLNQPEPNLPTPEETRERNRRLQILESSLEQWYIADQEQEYARKGSVAALLKDYSQKNLDAIVSDLRHGSPRHRRTMSAALGFSERPAAVVPLLEALQDQYYEVVLHSLLSLYHLAQVETNAQAPIVIEADAIVPYLRHPRPEVRGNAALALSRMVNPTTPKTVLLALIASLSDQDPHTRVHAVGAIGAFRDREAFPHLVKALDDPVQLVRIRAALALGRAEDPDAVPYLIQVLEREEEKVDVKRAAARSLAAIKKVKEASIEPSYWKGLRGAEGRE